MRIMYLGDTHGKFSVTRDAIRHAVDTDCERIIQVGDFGYWPTHYPHFLNRLGGVLEGAGLDLYFIDGNHEEHSALSHEVPAIHQMRERIFHWGRGVVMDLRDDGGPRMLGIGGAVSTDKYMRTPDLDWFRNEAPDENEFARAMRATDIDVVVSHEAPARPPLRGMSNELPPDIEADTQRVVRRLGQLRNVLEPEYWFHGHWHARYSLTIEGTKVKGLGRDGAPMDSFAAVLDWPARAIIKSSLTS